MIKLVPIFCISLLCFSSCQNPSQEHITQLVEEWQGKEVRFPENPVFTRQLGDTVDYRILEAEYDWKEIAPDEQKEIVVSYKGEEPGDFWRTVTVYGNIPGQSLALSFVGRVE